LNTIVGLSRCLPPLYDIRFFGLAFANGDKQSRKTMVSQAQTVCKRYVGIILSWQAFRLFPECMSSFFRLDHVGMVAAIGEQTQEIVDLFRFQREFDGSVAPSP
jgi:hypothetical protein